MSGKVRNLFKEFCFKGLNVERLPLPARIVRPLGYPTVSDLPKEQQEGLRSFWRDGLFASIASGFSDPYYTLYLLSLNATNAQIGLFNTLTQLVGAATAMPGAAAADRSGRYKGVTLFAGFVSRLMWPVMILAPWLAGGSAIWVVLVGWVTIAAMGSLGNAAWTALSAELVPARLRGGYFASRNMIIQLASLGAIPTAGLLVSAVGEPGGYQVSLALALIAGGFSLYYYSRLPEHPREKDPRRLSTWQVLRRVRHYPTFTRFTISHAVMMLGVWMGGPFINVYMKDVRGFSISTIGFVTTIGGLATLLSMRMMARVHDRVGIVRTMRFGVGIPLIMVGWMLVRHPWQAYLANTIAAFAWAGYNLGSFNLMLASTPDENRPRYIAVNTTIISLVGAAGPAIGGWLVDQIGFGQVFLISAIIRALGLLLFFILVREPESATPGIPKPQPSP
ncbi:MFS transporter [bacterium]|nr:MAG: MFS transporter [bacterium]